jgi:hypothetical protein
VSETTLVFRIVLQLNTMLFAKTLVKKDLTSVASKTATLSVSEGAAELPPISGTGSRGEVITAIMKPESLEKADDHEDDEAVTSKSQILVREAEKRSDDQDSEHGSTPSSDFVLRGH